MQVLVLQSLNVRSQVRRRRFRAFQLLLILRDRVVLAQIIDAHRVWGCLVQKVCFVSITTSENVHVMISIWEDRRSFLCVRLCAPLAIIY